MVQDVVFFLRLGDHLKCSLQGPAEYPFLRGQMVPITFALAWKWIMWVSPALGTTFIRRTTTGQRNKHPQLTGLPTEPPVQGRVVDSTCWRHSSVLPSSCSNSTSYCRNAPSLPDLESCLVLSLCQEIRYKHGSCFLHHFYSPFKCSATNLFKVTTSSNKRELDEEPFFKQSWILLRKFKYRFMYEC